MDLSKKRIMLTGGAGFLGSFVTEKLKARGCKHIFIPKEQNYDLTKPAPEETNGPLRPGQKDAPGAVPGLPPAEPDILTCLQHTSVCPPAFKSSSK